MRLKTLAMSAGAALALTACASGGSSSGPTREPIRALMSADALMFVSFDADGDLAVSAAEIEAGIGREFARADANSDGSIAPIEFQNWSNQVLGGTQMGPYRLDFDRNVDNTITREEFEAEVRGRVSDYDEDQSGTLARREFVRLIGQARPPAERRPEQQPGAMTRPNG
ncbi:EF-hand domain-containing protein [Vitreimonas flagellata]|uniref:EF-hand domain-containing protein n=1 Tax=Vitreimonas flagellata TaxID=2560861 RepID=UPI00107559F8|nr:hypothetical protein [Vitreimonas flagellata]